MATPNYFSDAYRVSAKGRQYVYAWKGKGAPRLPGDYGSPESLAAWLSAVSVRNLGADAQISGLIDRFKEQPRWTTPTAKKAYSDSTKTTFEMWFKRIEAEFGDCALVAFERKEIRTQIIEWRGKWESQPCTADKAIECLRALLSFGERANKLSVNHARKIEKLYESDRSELIWSPANLAALEAAASLEVYQAAKLASLTGIRKGDLLALKRTDVQPHLISFYTQKSRYKTRATIPVYDELKAFLATLPQHTETVLTNTRKQPWGTGFNASWQTAKDRAAEKLNDPEAKAELERLHFHDLRGTAATKFYVADFQPAQIARFMGWKEGPVAALIDRYVKEDELMLAYAQKMNGKAAAQAENENSSEKLSEKLAANDA